MQFFLRILMLLLLFWSSLVYLTRPRQNYQSAWQTYTTCAPQYVCWHGITPAKTSPQQALTQLDTSSETLFIEIAESGQSVQWQYPQGYQGYMVFDQGTIAFLEMQFPIFIDDAYQIRLADIILDLGVPVEYARFPDGTTQLYYYDHWLIVRLDTRLTSRLTPDVRVMSLHLASPFGQGISRPRGLIMGHSWGGFNQLPLSPPWGP